MLKCMSCLKLVCQHQSLIWLWSTAPDFKSFIVFLFSLGEEKIFKSDLLMVNLHFYYYKTRVYIYISKLQP